MTIAIGVFSLIALLICGLPVALAMALAGALGLYLIGGVALVSGILSSAPLSAIGNYEIITIPLFILMANFIVVSGVSDDMFDITKKWMGRTPGGLAHATALTGAVFGAISGSSTAAAATLASTSIPGMIKQGYNPRLAAGVAAISGTLAMLIPPSVAMVLYALISGMSVGKLLIAGIVPGILVTFTIMLTVAYLVWKHPEHAPRGRAYSFIEKVASLRTAWTFILLFLAVTGVIYLGIGTPTEASALGAFTAFLLAVGRRTSIRSLVRAVVGTIETTCMIALIVVGAQIFGWFITMTQATNGLIDFVTSSGIPPLGVLMFILLVYLILGSFMDLVAMLILTVPIVAPMIVEVGYDPIWFAVITIVMGEVGMVTPPLGMNVFVISKYTKLPVTDVFAGSYPHVVAHLLLVAFLVAFPQVVTWLPASMSH